MVIERREEFNFIGMTINENFIWISHAKKDIKQKITDYRDDEPSNTFPSICCIVFLFDKQPSSFLCLNVGIWS